MATRTIGSGQVGTRISFPHNQCERLRHATPGFITPVVSTFSK